MDDCQPASPVVEKHLHYRSGCLKAVLHSAFIIRDIDGTHDEQHHSCRIPDNPEHPDRCRRHLQSSYCV